MANPHWKTGSPIPRRAKITWPSMAQLLRQFGLAILAAALWGGALAGYLQLTGEPAEAAPVAVVAPTRPATPRPTNTPTPTPTPTPLPTDTPAPPAATAVTTATAVTPTPLPEPASTPTAEPTPLPTDTPIPAIPAAGASFAADILPILESRCIKCHGGDKTEEGLVLKTYADVMAGSWNGLVVEPGDVAGSFLVEQVMKGEMPKKGPRLLPSEVEAIIAWIEAGAPDN